jgi:DNA-binding response OmpR family regulator
MPHATIAIVEDEPTISEMYRLKLELEGFTVVSAMNGQEGLEIIKKHKPDLVLVDIKMPVMTGDEMLEKLRATDWGATVKVIILTNISRDEAPHSLRLLNIDRYIVKAHYTPAQVIDEVRKVLDIRGVNPNTAAKPPVRKK